MMRSNHILHNSSNITQCTSTSIRRAKCVNFQTTATGSTRNHFILGPQGGSLRPWTFEMAPRSTDSCAQSPRHSPPPFGEAGSSPLPSLRPHTLAPAPCTHAHEFATAQRAAHACAHEGGPPTPGAFAQLCEACTTESPLWFVHGDKADRERCSPRPAGWGLAPHLRRTRAAHRAASSWPDALRSPACYRTPTPDLLARLGRVRADWRGGGPAPADGRPRPPVPFARGARYT